MRRSLSLAACLLACSVLAWAVLPGTAAAQIRRCTGADGTSVFTDRRCEDIGAVERRPQDASPATGLRGYRGGCMRNLHELTYEITYAIDSRDPNRLAAVYHWPGLSSRSGYAVMQRLARIVDRPLVDIRVLTPPPPPVADTTFLPMQPPHAAAEQHPPPPPPRPRAPTGLRLHQTLANGSTPTETVFGLRRHFGCWWIAL